MSLEVAPSLEPISAPVFHGEARCGAEMNELAQQICADSRWPEIDESALHEAMSNAIVYGGFGLPSDIKGTLDMTKPIPEGQKLIVEIIESTTFWTVRITNPVTSQGRALPSLTQIEKTIQDETASIGNWERTNQRGLFLINQYAQKIMVDGNTLILVFNRAVPTTRQAMEETVLRLTSADREVSLLKL